MVSVEVTTENNLHTGHIYKRENRSEDNYIAQKEDIGRPVVMFLDDPRTPDQVKDDSFTAFWVF
jgi:hypothetical protein